MLLLDLGIAKLLIAGDPKITAKLERLSGSEWLVPANVAAELAFAVDSNPRLDGSVRYLVEKFIENSQIVPLDLEALKLATAIYKSVSTSKKLAAFQNACVSGLALSLDAIIATRNPELYAGVKELRVDVW